MDRSQRGRHARGSVHRQVLPLPLEGEVGMLSEDRVVIHAFGVFLEHTPMLRRAILVPAAGVFVRVRLKYRNGS